MKKVTWPTKIVAKKSDMRVAKINNALEMKR